MAKRVLKAGGLLLMAAVLVLNLCTMLLNGLGLNEQLNWLPGALLTVESGSMEPILSEGDLLLIWETPYEELQVGDIVTFHGNNELVTHRIIRQEGDLFVPKGTANNVEDAPIGRTEYCAKVIGTVPRGGMVLDLLTTPMILAVLVLLVLAAFFGTPILNRLLSKTGQEEAAPARLGIGRMLAAGTVISMCCVVPFVTAAKYTADINEYGFAEAGVTYFSSNYLTEEGKNHSVRGWPGDGYGLTLEMYNYENGLLCSQKNIPYQLHVEIDGSDGYETNYEVKIKNDPNPEVPALGTATADVPFYRSDHLSANVTDTDGKAKPQKDLFPIEVVVEDGALSAGEKIRFRIEARTTDAGDFKQTLSGVFTFEVAPSGSFLGQQEMETSQGTALVTYNIKTQPAGGVSSKEIEISWPSDLMYINEYETTVANVITHNPADFNRGGTNAGDRGRLVLTLKAYSNVTLQFFKYDPDAAVSDSAIICVEKD